MANNQLNKQKWTDKLAFCSKCENLTVYNEKREIFIEKYKSELIEFEGYQGLCSVCNSYVWADDLVKKNDQIFFEIYRQRKGLISMNKIVEIKEKYNIGARPLSKLLGWGELTFTRYLEGFLPTIEYSNTLQEIYDDPYKFQSILLKNKDKILKSAFYKSLKALNKIINSSTSKIETVSQYLIDNSLEITQLSLNKLLYYANGFSLALFNKTMFNDKAYAWKYGPVYPSIYKKYKQFKKSKILDKTNVVFDSITQQEKDILNILIKDVLKYGSTILVELTHNETPWIESYDNNNEQGNNIIEKDKINSYFNTVVQKYNIKNCSDISRYFAFSNVFAKIIKMFPQD